MSSHSLIDDATIRRSLVRKLLGNGCVIMKHRDFIRPCEVRAFWISLVLVLLALAAINVAFAVTRIQSRTAPQVPVIEGGFGVTPSRRDWVISTPHDQPWPAPTSWEKRGRFGLRVYDIRWSNPEPETNGFSLSLQHLGWPLPVLEIKQMWWDWNNPALQGPESDPRPHLIPLGLVANPVIVGVPLWLAMVVVPIGLVVIRRIWRARGGRCAWCGYELTGVAVCPECGPADGPSRSA